MTKFLKIYTDGGSRGNPGLAAIGVVVYLDEKIVYELSKSIGRGTNNEAEYQAMINSINWLLTSQYNHADFIVKWHLDSKLVVEQVNKNWKIKQPHLRELAEIVWQNLKKLKCEYQIIHVPREKNKIADALVNQALDA